MRYKYYIAAALIILTLPTAVLGQFKLWVMEKRLEMKYDVPNISHVELAEKLKSKAGAHILLFDTRLREEYDTSHIAGAIYVDPAMTREDFIKRYGEKIKDKELIFYCSVGDRSSNFLERVRKPALEKGAESLSNLRGGIFRWYNEGHPVINKQGETDDIHPFDEEWGRLIEKRE